MTWLLHDSMGLALVKCVSSCLYERTHPAGISCAWTQGIWILECNGLGVYFFKYSNEPQIKQDFYCIWYSADNKRQGNWRYWQRGTAKRGDTSRCPYCCLVHRSLAVPHPISRSQCEWNEPLRAPEDPELHVKSAEFRVGVKPARLDLRTSD